MNRSPLAAGFDAAFRHTRLALSLWLFLFATALLAWLPLKAAFSSLDDSPFREALLKGWDGWGAIAFAALHGRELSFVSAVAATVFLAALLLHVFLVGGLLRVLIADVERPVMRRLVAESAALFRPNLWATLRFAVRLAIWEVLLVAIPAGLLGKLAGKDAPPHDPLSNLASWWTLVVGALVFLVVLARFDLTRVALARGDAPTAGAAGRVAGMRLSGSRPGVVALLLFWLLAAAACQVLFTRIGIAMNPSTSGGMTALVVVRQLGFLALAVLRVGWWASLLAWERLRRPAAMPVPMPARPVELSAAV